MKVKQEREELTKMAEKELSAQTVELAKEIFKKTVAAHKNELKNVREIRVHKKRLARIKTLIFQKKMIKEQV